MAYDLITSYNLTRGMHVPFIYINDITGGLFMRLVLFAFWIIIALGLYFHQKTTTGSGDFPQGVAVAGFSTFVLTVLFRLIEGLVDGWTFAVVIVVAVLGVLWLMFSRDN